MTDDGEGPVLPEEARERVKGFHDKPEHKFHPGPDGKDPRDERTRGDRLDDPAFMQSDAVPPGHSADGASVD